MICVSLCLFVGGMPHSRNYTYSQPDYAYASSQQAYDSGYQQYDYAQEQYDYTGQDSYECSEQYYQLDNRGQNYYQPSNVESTV